MNRKKIAYIAYISAFFTACAVPSAGMLFTDIENTSEKRQLAAMPSLKDENGSFNKEFGIEFEEYLSDHFAFRSSMVTAYDKLSDILTKTSPQNNVIIGSDDFLYYAPTVNDYVNYSAVSETGAKHMARTLSMINDYAKKCNAELIFTSAPNKNSVYPEYMPSRYIQTESDDTLTMLEKYLACTDVKYCNLRSYLQEKAVSDDNLLYHKWDTHWNNYGALQAYDYLLDSMELSHYDYSDIKYSKEKVWSGDLYTILYPESDKKDDNYIYDYEFQYNYIGRFRGLDDLSIKTQNENGNNSLLMFRDSFAIALIPFLSEIFSSATYQTASHYPVDIIEQQQIDFVVIEIAERNIANLLAYAPQMPAPAMQINSVSECKDNITKPSLNIEKTNNYLHIFGDYDMNFSDNQNIYIHFNSETGEAMTYEAFPCYEHELLEKDNICDNGYSLYVPLNSFDTSTYSVNVIVSYDGELINIGTAGQFRLGGN